MLLVVWLLLTLVLPSVGPCPLARVSSFVLFACFVPCVRTCLRAVLLFVCLTATWRCAVSSAVRVFVCPRARPGLCELRRDEGIRFGDQARVDAAIEKHSAPPAPQSGAPPGLCLTRWDFRVGVPQPPPARARAVEVGVGK